MTTVDLTNPIFTSPDKAREHFESIRWPNGPYCPYCGVTGDRVATLGGKSMGRRSGRRGRIPLNPGCSAFLKTAWFMAHRIREGLRELNPSGPLGGEGKTVEADETYIGGKEKNKHRKKRVRGNIGGKGKEIAFALVERGGRVRSQVVSEVAAKTLRPILVAQLDANTFLMTDDAGQYRHMHKDFRHEVIKHGIGEYVRGEAHTNTVEGYFSILKRGITGTYHHVSQQHLKRYLAEFDFRYNERAALEVTDAERAAKAVAGVVGKRLTYQETNRTSA